MITKFSLNLPLHVCQNLSMRTVGTDAITGIPFKAKGIDANHLFL
jgi:hypothetical protein